MKFEWDFRKAEINQEKHGVDFGEALEVFGDPNALYGNDPEHSISERRFFVIGISKNQLLFVVYVEKDGGETIRIISARRADRRHHFEYAKQLF
ncbi:MAG: BrnT family toxin [Acidobacteria bacterium]|nr:BrnT family toxin [Acidobacteriota bacterium]